MKKYDPERPVIFTHVPKCAGTSFVQVLKKWFGTGYHKLNQDETRDILLPKVDTRDENGNWRPDVRCIHGHFNHGRGYGLPYYYPEVDQYFTVLRDPFDLTVSMYFFAKGRSSAGRFWFRGKQVDFSSLFPSVDDYLRSYPYWLFHHFPQDITLDNYQERLAKRFIYIGIVEDLDNSVCNLAKILGMPRIEVPLLNVSEYDEVIPGHLRAQFYHDYPLLKSIYDFAVKSYRIPESQVNPPKSVEPADNKNSPRSEIRLLNADSGSDATSQPSGPEAE